MATHSVRDKVREVVDVLTPRVGEMDGMTEELREQAIATATSELLKIIESEVIGEDEPTPPVTTGNIDGVTFYDQVDDMLRPGRNKHRESQREKLK